MWMTARYGNPRVPRALSHFAPGVMVLLPPRVRCGRAARAARLALIALWGEVPNSGAGPGLRGARTAFTLLIALLASVETARAQCVLPPATGNPGGFLATPAARYASALTYADHQCLPEAKALLTEAAAGLATQTGSRAATLRNLVTSAAEYVAALDAIARGDRTTALAQLQRIVDRGPNAVSLRAAITLATAVVHESDTTRWQPLEEVLEELARRGYVEAELLLMERLRHREGIAAAIAAVEHRLGEDLDLQRALSLEVLLIELYARADRLLDAVLLLTVVERDAATTLLDLKMRKRLLEAGLSVSSALIGHGRSEFTAQREAYARGLAELKRFVP